MRVDAVLIAGPTASGKSAAALALAERARGIVVNTDSMQVYRETRILTARPSPEDEARAPHLLYGHVGVDESYSVARFQADAADAFEAARRQKRLPIFVGGTGLYFSALIDGLADIPSVPAEIRTLAKMRRDELGPEAFHAELAARDGETAQRLRPSDAQRVLRAYEVFEATGRPISAWQSAKPLQGPLSGLALARFVIEPERALLRRRIDRRFDVMLADGAMEEAAALVGLDPARPAAKILGLRELQAVRAVSMTLDEARAAAQAATRQYAKRQLTWFRNRMADWPRLDSTGSGNFLTEILSQLI
jgi:tRNA dimethylallyltransferase